MATLQPDQARVLGLAKELTDPTLQQGDLVIVMCDDDIERVGYFAHTDSDPYWMVLPMDLVIKLGRNGGVFRGDQRV